MNGPNRPCECNSGKKQKKCHPFGAPLEGPDLPPRKNQPPVVRDSGSEISLMLATLMVMSLGRIR